MFEKGAQMRSKRAAPVTVKLTGEAPVQGAVFLRHDERLLDLLNDERAFIPVRVADGGVMIVAKSAIQSIIELQPQMHAEDVETSGGGDAFEAEEDWDGASAETADAGEDAAPSEEDAGARRRREQHERRRRLRAVRLAEAYRTLGVQPADSTDAVRRAYKSRIKEVHPDTFAGSNADPKKMREAVEATQAVNKAYHLILKERGPEAPAAEAS